MEKPTLLDMVTPFSGKYSLRADILLNKWLTFGLVAQFWAGYVVEQQPGWSAVTRALVLLLPMILYVVQIRVWLAFLRGLDELQRKIQSEAWLFAVVGALLIVAAINTLNGRGVAVPSLEHGLSLNGALLLTFLLWPLGRWFANRRYR